VQPSQLERGPAVPRGRRVPSLTSAAAFSAVGVGVAGVARFAYSLLVGRFEGVTVLGTVNAGISLAVLASMVWPAATGSAASKFLARSEGAAERSRPASAGVAGSAAAGADTAAVAAHLVRRTAVSGVLLAAAAVLVARTVLHSSWGTATLVGLLALAYSGYLLARGSQFGRLRFGVAAASEAVSAVLSAGLLLAVLLLGWNGLLLLPMTIAYATYTVIGWPRGARGRPAAADRREMDAFVAWGVVGNVASAGLLQLSQVVAEAQDHSRAGLYAAAVSLATPASLLSRSLAQVLFPSMARAAGGGDAGAVRRQTDAATRGLVTVMVGVFGVLLLLAEPLLHVYGARFVPATPLLQSTLVAVLLSTVSVAAVTSLTSGAASGIRASAGMSAAGFVVGGAVMAATAPSAGVTGVAAGYFAGTTVTAVLPWLLVWRQQRMAWGGLSVRLLAAVAVLVAVALVQRDLSGTATTVVGLAAAVVFGLAWAALNRRELRVMVASVRPAPSARPGS
jgi:putative peptidoglycan lipid II flippase